MANQFGYMKTGSILFWCFFAAGGLAPTAMGVFLSLKSNKIKHLKELLKDSAKVKQPLEYYGMLLLFFTLSFAIPALRGSLQGSVEWYWAPLIILKLIFFGGLEEIGWRYTLQPALEKHFSFGVSSSITALLWSFWHLPLFFMEGINDGMDFGLFTLHVFEMSFILGALYRTSQSVWLCILFHAMINAFSQIWIDVDQTQNPLVLILTSTSLKVLISLILVAWHDRFRFK
jgi:membrane protease YdiL (CAAX protease family)